MFYGCFYSIVLNSQIYFCLVLRKSKEGWRPLRLCLGQRKKKCKLSVQLEALNTPALMSQTCQRVKMESRNSQGTLWKKSPGRDQHLQKLKEASMMQLLKGSLLGQGQTFCQGEGILISQTGNGHLIVSTGQSGLHLPLHQHPINPSLQERQRPHYHQDQGQQRPHCHQPGQRLQFRPWRLLRDLLLWVWHQVVRNQSALHDQKRRHVKWQLRQNFRHWTFSFWITIIIDAIKCLFLNFWGNQTV